MKNHCKNCGRCCNILYFTDQLILSIKTRSWAFYRNCKFRKNDRCSIYEIRPKFCRQWKCGVFPAEKE